MRIKLVISLFFFPIVFAVHQCNSTVRFGSYNSTISLANGATFDVANSFTNYNGTIIQGDDSSILGAQIYFHDGFFEQTRSPITITGNYVPDPTGTGTIHLYGTKHHPNVLRASPGGQINNLQIRGDANRIEGFPSFLNPIYLVDKNTTATIAIQSVLNQNIHLNGGTIILEENLVLADGVSIHGHGTIELNDRRLEFGAKDLKMGSSLYWKGAADVYLNGKIELSASWTFEGDCYFNGDSTVLTLTEGADLTIRDNSSLNIRELKIEGLGTDFKNGRFLFADLNTSTLRLRRAALALTTTYTHDRGTIIAEIGSNQIITRDKMFYVEEPGHLLVDGINLFYKTRTFTNNYNIRPTEIVTELTPLVDSPIETKNQGQILHYKSFSSRKTLQSTNNNGVLSENLYLGTGKTFAITPDQPTVDGNGWYIQLSTPFPPSTSDLPQIIVEANTTAELKNIVIKDYVQNSIHPVAATSNLVLGDQTTIEFASKANSFRFTHLVVNTTPVRIRGFVVLDAKGNTIALQNKFVIEDGATLLLKNIHLQFIESDRFEFEGTTSRLILSNAKLSLLRNLTLSNGSITIADDVEIIASLFFALPDINEVSFIFQPGTGNDLTINANSRLHFGRNVTFSCAPIIPNNQTVLFTDKSSILSFDGATLFATSTGLRLTKGSLQTENKSFIKSDATNIYEAISFGDGVNPANDFDIACLSGGNFELLSGILEYNNVGG